jgi:uncharacterized delta-60 repeat protein
MATITYQCSICERQIDLLENTQGLTVFGKCIITNGCKGKLNQLTRNPDNNRETFPSEVPGLQDYVQRKALFTYTQTLPQNVWNIQHNMGVSPAVDVYIYNQTNTLVPLSPTQYTITLVDQNNITLTFNTVQTGIAQLVARSTAKIQPQTITPATSPFQVTSNGVFIFAVPKYLTKFDYPPSLIPNPQLPYDLQTAPIRIEVMITEPNTESVICTEYLDTSLFNTPWNDWNEILVRKRKNYYLFSKSILNFRTFGEETTSFSSIPNGTQLAITRIDYGTGVLQPIDAEGLLILLANSPYTSADKIQNQVIDVADMVDNVIPYFTYNTTDFFVDQSCVEKTYPNILNVQSSFYPSPSPTPSPSLTPSITPTITISMSATPAPSFTPTVTPSVTPTMTPATPYVYPPFLSRSYNTGNVDTTFANLGLSDFVNVITQTSDDHIYVGGNFASETGNTYSGLLRLTSAGALDTTFTINMPSDSEINSIIQTSDGKIWIGGSFTSLNGTYNNLARLNSNGTLDTTYTDLGINGAIDKIFQAANGVIYIGGDFTSVDGNAYTNLAQLNLNGTVNTSFADLGLNGTTVSTIYQTTDNNIYIGGDFTNINSYYYLLRLTSAGALDTTFGNLDIQNDTGSSYPVEAMLEIGSYIFLAGKFTNINGNTYNYFARLNSNGTLDTNFVDLGLNGEVDTILATTNNIFVGGFFSGTYNYFARLSLTGTLDTTFTDLGLNNAVYALTQTQDGKIYIGGDFTNAG